MCIQNTVCWMDPIRSRNMWQESRNWAWTVQRSLTMVSCMVWLIFIKRQKLRESSRSWDARSMWRQVPGLTKRQEITKIVIIIWCCWRKITRVTRTWWRSYRSGLSMDFTISRAWILRHWKHIMKVSLHWAPAWQERSHAISCVECTRKHVNLLCAIRISLEKIISFWSCRITGFRHRRQLTRRCCGCQRKPVSN